MFQAENGGWGWGGGSSEKSQTVACKCDQLRLLLAGLPGRVLSPQRLGIEVHVSEVLETSQVLEEDTPELKEVWIHLQGTERILNYKPF